MSAPPPFDPTCPWRASCKSRRITTSAGLLRHLQRFHNLSFSGRDQWLSQLSNPVDYSALEAALRASGQWLCTTCFKTHAIGVHLCSTHPDTCQRLWNLQDGLPPVDINVLPGIPQPAQLIPQHGATGCPTLGTHRQCPRPPDSQQAPPPQPAAPPLGQTPSLLTIPQVPLDSHAAVICQVLR